MELNLSQLSTLVPAAPCCVLCYNTSNLLRFDTSNLIWNHTHRQTDTGNTGTDRLTHTYKYKNNTCAHNSSPVLHWLNNLLKQKFTLQMFTMSFLFKNYSLVEVIYICLLDSARLSSSSETQRIPMEMVYMSKTHTYHTHWEK